MSTLDLSRQFFKLLVHFREHNLISFADEHCRLHAEAGQTGEYGPCIAHYYSVMSKLIEEYFCGSFHFVPPLQIQQNAPEKFKKKKNLRKSPKGVSSSNSLPASIRQLHLRIAECLELGPGKSCVDIGCGIGDVVEHLAITGAMLTGLTIAPNEVQIGNANFRSLGIQNRCRLIQADCTKTLPLATGSQDSAYAIYSLKYFPKLGPIFGEFWRVIKTDGLLLVYDLLKTDKFDHQNAEHRSLLEGLEFACGMPPLHSRAEMLEAASNAGFVLANSVDLDAEVGKPFHFWFSHSPTFMWMMRSPIIGQLIKMAQILRILPPGFHRFNKIFLSGTVDKIVRAGELGILSGAEILLFRRKMNQKN